MVPRVLHFSAFIAPIGNELPIYYIHTLVMSNIHYNEAINDILMKFGTIKYLTSRQVVVMNVASAYSVVAFIVT